MPSAPSPLPTAAADWIEPCPHVLARTAGQALITDDNMGTEWRHVWEPQ